MAARLDRQTSRVAASRGDHELFATALLLEHRADRPAVEVVNCGHLAPLAVGPSGAREVAVPSLLPLGFGALGADAPTPRQLPLVDGESLLLYTDGLTEARNASGEFYPAADRVTTHPCESPAELLAFLDHDVRDWTHHLADDVALIALTRAETAPLLAA